VPIQEHLLNLVLYFLLYKLIFQTIFQRSVSWTFVDVGLLSLSMFSLFVSTFCLSTFVKCLWMYQLIYRITHYSTTMNCVWYTLSFMLTIWDSWRLNSDYLFSAESDDHIKQHMILHHPDRWPTVLSFRPVALEAWHNERVKLTINFRINLFWC